LKIELTGEAHHWRDYRNFKSGKLIWLPKVWGTTDAAVYEEYPEYAESKFLTEDDNSETRPVETEKIFENSLKETFLALMHTSS